MRVTRVLRVAVRFWVVRVPQNLLLVGWMNLHCPLSSPGLESTSNHLGDRFEAVKDGGDGVERQARCLIMRASEAPAGRRGREGERNVWRERVKTLVWG